MRTTQRLLALSAAVALTVSCGESPLGIRVEGTFEITDRHYPPEGAQPGLEYEPSFGVNGGDGTVALEGSFWGDGCGDRMEPEFFHNGSELVFRLIFLEEIANPVCLAWVVVSDYTAEFQAVPPGTYELRVIHDHRRADAVRRFDVGEVTVR